MTFQMECEVLFYFNVCVKVLLGFKAVIHIIRMDYLMIIFHQLMLYVENQNTVADFWVEHLGFFIKQQETVSGVPIIVLSDGRENGTQIVLHDKNLIARYQPELNLATPSILLSTNEDIELLYQNFQSKNIQVGELMTLPTGQKVFNFADPENNYFAIIEND